MTNKAIKKPATIGRLSIEYVPRAFLKRNPQNPRRHSTRQIRQIARSIETFGFIFPLAIDAHGTIIVGHGRDAAAELLGLVEVPTIRVEHLSDAQKRAFMIADNRLTENSDWNEDLLAQQFCELSVMDLSFELEVTGFEVPEIDLLIEASVEPQADKLDPADAPPPPAMKAATSRVGDVWILGRHRIVCGDATNPDEWLTFRGFIVSDFFGRYGDYMHDVAAWVGEGRIKYREDVVEGLGKAPRALIGLLRGENFGKLLVRVAHASS
jgi:hypothetical protein